MYLPSFRVTTGARPYKLVSLSLVPPFCHGISESQTHMGPLRISHNYTSSVWDSDSSPTQRSLKGWEEGKMDFKGGRRGRRGQRKHGNKEGNSVTSPT